MKTYIAIIVIVLVLIFVNDEPWRTTIVAETTSVVDWFFCDEYIAAIVYIGGSGDNDGYRGSGGVCGGCVCGGSGDVYVMSLP